MKNLAALRYMLPWLTDDLDEIDDLFNGDPWPYGIENNLPTLNTLMQYMVEQGVIEKNIALNDLFLPV